MTYSPKSSLENPPKSQDSDEDVEEGNNLIGDQSDFDEDEVVEVSSTFCSESIDDMDVDAGLSRDHRCGDGNQVGEEDGEEEKMVNLPNTNVHYLPFCSMLRHVNLTNNMIFSYLRLRGHPYTS